MELGGFLVDFWPSSSTGWFLPSADNYVNKTVLRSCTFWVGFTKRVSCSATAIKIRACLHWNLWHHQILRETSFIGLGRRFFRPSFWYPMGGMKFVSHAIYDATVNGPLLKYRHVIWSTVDVSILKDVLFSVHRTKNWMLLKRPLQISISLSTNGDSTKNIFLQRLVKSNQKSGSKIDHYCIKIKF